MTVKKNYYLKKKLKFWKLNKKLTTDLFFMNLAKQN